jgi:hypothetical protein
MRPDGGMIGHFALSTSGSYTYENGEEYGADERLRGPAGLCLRDEGFCPVHFNISQWTERGIAMTYHSDARVGTHAVGAEVVNGQNQL